MKLAILICGEYREFESAHRSWDFLTKTDNDVFFSTWNRSAQENKGLDIYIDEVITEDKIKQFLPNAFISIVDCSVSDSLPNNTHRMHYHWKNALSMLKECNNTYTHVLIIRPDIFYQNHREEYDNYDQQIQPNVLYGGERITLVGCNVFGVDDTFFLGDFNTMSEFINDLPIETEMHHGLAQYIINKGWYVNQLQMGTSIVRGNCRNLKELDMNIVGQKRHEWYVAYHRHKENENEN